MVVWVLAGCDDHHEAGGPELGDDSMVQKNAPVVIAPDEADGPAEGDGWVSLVPEEGSGAWKALELGGEGPTEWKDGVLHIGAGADLSGMLWTGDLPEAPYEIALEARRTMGSDFFCGLTVPVRSKDVCVTLVVGGWGGDLVGVSCIDWFDAADNETTTYQDFEENTWYAVRMAVRKNRLQGWIGGEPVFDVDTTDRELSLRSGAIEEAAPLSLTTFTTGGEIRGIRWRALPEELSGEAP